MAGNSINDNLKFPKYDYSSNMEDWYTPLYDGYKLNNTRMSYTTYLSPGVHEVYCLTGAKVFPSNGENFPIAYVESHSGDIYYEKPMPGPVKFIAIDTNKDNYYSVRKMGYVYRIFDTRGTYTYTASTNRIKVMMIGASVVPSWHGNSRPESSESSFVGNGQDIRTSAFAGGINGASNTSNRNQNITAYHPSMGGNEHNDLFLADVIGVIPAYSEDKFTKINLVGYHSYLGAFIDSPLLDTRDASLAEDSTAIFRFHQLTNARRVGSFTQDLCLQSNLRGASYFAITGGIGNYQGNPGGYACSGSGTMVNYMGLSRLETREINVSPGQQFTITIGACPDIWVGRELSTTPGVGQLTCLNTRPFDGCVVIIEEQ